MVYARIFLLLPPYPLFFPQRSWIVFQIVITSLLRSSFLSPTHTIFLLVVVIIIMIIIIFIVITLSLSPLFLLFIIIIILQRFRYPEQPKKYVPFFSTASRSVVETGQKTSHNVSSSLHIVRRFEDFLLVAMRRVASTPDSKKARAIPQRDGDKGKVNTTLKAACIHIHTPTYLYVWLFSQHPSSWRSGPFCYISEARRRHSYA